jgi:hypothetical protein
MTNNKILVCVSCDWHSEPGAGLDRYGRCPECMGDDVCEEEKENVNAN